MGKIAFLGTGNMGGPMALNLIKANHEVCAFDIVPGHLRDISGAGGEIANSATEAVQGATTVITMLPAGEHVDIVYHNDILPHVPPGTVLIDCSTIDIATSKAVHASAVQQGCEMVDAPVSGGVKKAIDGTLTFMVGGSDTAFKMAEPYLSTMGANIFNCGDGGTGQAAKICNNMMLGIQMASVAEAFSLAENLGLDAGKLFNVVNVSSGQCWSVTNYCPVPGLVPAAPSNNDFEGGFAANLMLKDMNLALAAAAQTGSDVSVAEKATTLYQEFKDAGSGGKDFSGIIELVGKR